MSQVSELFVTVLTPQERLQLSKLPGAALKVWLNHSSHENANDESFPSLDTIAEETGLSKRTVKVWRKWLREQGWLKQTGVVLSTKGEYNIPKVRCTFPDIASLQSPVSDRTGGEQPPDTGQTVVRPSSEPLQTVVRPSSEPLHTAGSAKIAPDAVFDRVQKLHPEGLRFTDTDTNTHTHTDRQTGTHEPNQSVEGDASHLLNLQNRKTVEPTPAPLVRQRRPKLAKDGAPYPTDFNSWSNHQRLVWLNDHSKAVPVPVQAETAGEANLDGLAGDCLPVAKPAAVAAPMSEMLLEEEPLTSPPPTPPPPPSRKRVFACRCSDYRRKVNGDSLCTDCGKRCKHEEFKDDEYDRFHPEKYDGIVCAQCRMPKAYLEQVGWFETNSTHTDPLSPDQVTA